MTTQPPRAQGQRLGWDQLPRHIRGEIEGFLGEPVSAAQTMTGGFSPGLAARLTTASGRTVFAKAVCGVPNPVAPEFHRREIVVASRLPHPGPTPRLRWAFDEGGEGWVVLVFDAVDGRAPRQPWDRAELDGVIDALNELTVELTPSPIAIADAGSATSFRPLAGRNWAHRQAEGARHPDPWVARHLDRLVDAEAGVHAVLEGDTLLHMDLRGDNMLLTDGGVVIVDWPHARVGAPWIDAVGFAPSVALERGPEPEDLIARLDAPRTADPDHVTLGIIAIAGFFTYQGSLPPLEGLPGLREFQEAQGAIARRWVAQRTGWG